jgi:hypothetical protein
MVEATAVALGAKIQSELISLSSEFAPSNGVRKSSPLNVWARCPFAGDSLERTCDFPDFLRNREGA